MAELDAMQGLEVELMTVSPFGRWWPVVVEHDWYDGPRGGIVVDGNHSWYFQATYYDLDIDADRFTFWRCAPDALTLEREAWLIFVDWNDRYERGAAKLGDHPGDRGVNARYDELEDALTAARLSPDYAVSGRLSFRRPAALSYVARYRPEGVDYEVYFTEIGNEE